MFHGVTIGSSGIHLSHLFYVDDVIILSEWNQNDMENIIRILNIFYIASGLKINIHKLNVFGVGVSNNEIVSMAACTGCEPGSFHFSYVGLPIGSNMSCIVNWQVPEMVVKSLERLHAAFFRGGHEDTKKIAWVKCSNILASLDKGGLGVAIHGDEAGVDLRGCRTNGVWASIVGTINHLHSSGIVPLPEV
ncbi:RNA-directed DNA polymerase, eukaryota, reverse transcriptase zinc-binding domain protein [Tanacetum coccineum]